MLASTLYFLLCTAPLGTATAFVGPSLSSSPGRRIQSNRRAAATNHQDIISLEQQTVAELKNELKVRGLPVSGNKSILIDRLMMDSGTSRSKQEETVAEDDLGFVIDDDDDENASLSRNEDQGFIIEDGNDSAPMDDDFDLMTTKKTTTTTTTAIDLLPAPLLQALSKRITPNDNASKTLSLLSVQELAFKPISSGSDAVLFAPTGSGKTLGYALPLLTRLLEWKKEGTLKKRRRLDQQDYYNTKQREPARPSIMVLAPSRELAKQVGKVLSHYHPTSSGRVGTVFGGVPLERHVSLLRRDLDVVVGTPGRIRELIREGHLTTEFCKSIVLDEADVLLNFDDQPEIEMLLDGMVEDYQLVLASATVNRRVKEFVKDVMEINETSEAFVEVDAVVADETGTQDLSPSSKGSAQQQQNRPTVRHWSTGASFFSRTGLAADIIATQSPRIGIIFVASKAEADSVSEELSEKLGDTKVSVLHGDMSQSARSRTVASLRNNINNHRSKILVATDIASRGLDLPGVDLVLQFGIPRKSGKDGTFDSELYLHRAGRAGRVGGGSKDADAILLFDPAEGEGKLLPELESELHSAAGIRIQPRALPSPSEIMEASYERAKRICDDVVVGDKDFSNYFTEKIDAEISADTSKKHREELLMDKLAAAMAALSGLGDGGVVAPRSLLTADTRDRTIRVFHSDGKGLAPPEVTKFVKGLGSGKLGRVTICNDGSAVFDLSAKRAERLLEAYREMNGQNQAGLRIVLPSELPL